MTTYDYDCRVLVLTRTEKDRRLEIYLGEIDSPATWLDLGEYIKTTHRVRSDSSWELEIRYMSKLQFFNLPELKEE